MTEPIPLACGICRRETVTSVVCHHCGRPLCDRCRVEWPDTAFPGQQGIASAYHCRACRKRHHIAVGDVLTLARSYTTLFLRRTNRALRRGRDRA